MRLWAGQSPTAAVSWRHREAGGRSRRAKGRRRSASRSGVGERGPASSLLCLSALLGPSMGWLGPARTGEANRFAESADSNLTWEHLHRHLDVTFS